ncbi:hypothetical protein ACFL34_06075, partial [Candidatus Sumerlaeota bacterium]
MKHTVTMFLFLLSLMLAVDGRAAADRPTSRTFNLRLLCTSLRGGELEPCGCEKRDEGGLDRESWLIKDFARREGSFLLLDTGGAPGQAFTEQAVLRVRYLLDALDTMDFLAINVDRNDDALLADMLTDRAARTTGTALLSASIFDPATSAPVYLPHRIVAERGPNRCFVGPHGYHLHRPNDQEEKGGPACRCAANKGRTH